MVCATIHSRLRWVRPNCQLECFKQQWWFSQHSKHAHRHSDCSVAAVVVVVVVGCSFCFSEIACVLIDHINAYWDCMRADSNSINLTQNHETKRKWASQFGWSRFQVKTNFCSQEGLTMNYWLSEAEWVYVIITCFKSMTEILHAISYEWYLCELVNCANAHHLERILILYITCEL